MQKRLIDGGTRLAVAHPEGRRRKDKIIVFEEHSGWNKQFIE